jgi:hypothetical protein
MKKIVGVLMKTHENLYDKRKKFVRWITIAIKSYHIKESSICCNNLKASANNTSSMHARFLFDPQKLATGCILCM